MNESTKRVNVAIDNIMAVIEGPDDGLGVGRFPTLEQRVQRRILYSRWRVHLIGPLSRKAARANTPAKIRQLRKLLNRVDSAAAQMDI